MNPTAYASPQLIAAARSVSGLLATTPRIAPPAKPVRIDKLPKDCARWERALQAARYFLALHNDAHTKAQSLRFGRAHGFRYWEFGRAMRAAREELAGSHPFNKANARNGGACENTPERPESVAVVHGVSGESAPGQFQQGASEAGGFHTPRREGSTPSPATNFTASRSDPRTSPASPCDQKRTVHVHAGERRTGAAVQFQPAA